MRPVSRWFESRITNGLLEGMNSLVQAAKARARGYRSAHYMATIVYLLLSKLDFKQPRVLPAVSMWNSEEAFGYRRK